MYSKINSRAKTDSRFSSNRRPLAYFSPEFSFWGAVRINSTKPKRKKSPKGRREGNRLLCFTFYNENNWNIDINALINFMISFLSGITTSAARFKSFKQNDLIPRTIRHTRYVWDTCKKRLEDAGHEFKNKGYDLTVFLRLIPG